MKYTDIDYYVFTDAARFVSRGGSPYERETYRYTPLLAWMLLPTTWSGTLFSFGKVLFAFSDIVAGWLIVLVLVNGKKMSMERALKFASIWLLNPMVATISTRGSSEGLLGVMVIALLWAITQKKIALAGVLLGLGVHFKIYPFIYAPSIIWWLDDEHIGSPNPARKAGESRSLVTIAKNFLNEARMDLTVTSLLTFLLLNTLMYTKYDFPFIQHTYLHHVTRIDHRHNFSPYNTLLYLSSTSPSTHTVKLESLAFIPQLFLSAFALPLLLAKKDLPSTMLAQTFAFVTFNKVCTSQYFLWYTILLPLYLSITSCTLLSSPRTGLLALALWVAAQVLWLQQGFQLEFLGKSTFVPGLWGAGLAFFAVNCWILGVVVKDIGNIGNTGGQAKGVGEKVTKRGEGKVVQ